MLKPILVQCSISISSENVRKPKANNERLTPKGSLKKLNNLFVGLKAQLLVTTPTIMPTSLTIN